MLSTQEDTTMPNPFRGLQASLKGLGPALLGKSKRNPLQGRDLAPNLPTAAEDALAPPQPFDRRKTTPGALGLKSPRGSLGTRAFGGRLGLRLGRR